jgi:hypothetical protein
MTRAAPLRAKVLAVCGDGEWRSIAAIAERAGLPVKSTRGILWHAARRQQARSRASTGSREYRVTILKAQRRCQQPSAATISAQVLAAFADGRWRGVGEMATAAELTPKQVFNALQVALSGAGLGLLRGDGVAVFAGRKFGFWLCLPPRGACWL